jgi:selenide,water dikinase
MRCTGCGGKVSARVLRSALSRIENCSSEVVLTGLYPADDVAIIAIPQNSPAVISADFFAAFLDDPYVVGRIAANKAGAESAPLC